MGFPLSLQFALAAWGATGAAAESFSLNNFISIVASLGSELAPSTTPSSSPSQTRSSTHSSTASSTLTTSASPTPTSASPSVTAASASRAAASQTAAAQSGGIDPHTRTIIIAVCVVVGLLLLALLVGLCLCLRRRKRRQTEHHTTEKRHKRRWSPALLFSRKGKRGHHRQASEDSAADTAYRGGAGSEWEKHSDHHHGFVHADAAAGAIAHHNGHPHSSEHGLLDGRRSEGNGRPSMQRPLTNEHPAFRESTDGHHSNPFSSQSPPPRKPVPSNGHDHHAGGLVAAAGAGVGAAALYKHHQHKKENEQASHAQPLGHHPVDERINRPGTSNNGWPLSGGQPEPHGFGGAVMAHDRAPNRNSAPGEYRNSANGQYRNSASGEYQPVQGKPTAYADDQRSYDEGFDDSRYSYDSHNRHSGSAPLAAGAVALAGAGAMAHHEHNRHSGDEHNRHSGDEHNRHSSSIPLAAGALAHDSHKRDSGERRNSANRTSYDPYRPPTPMGLERATQHSPPTPAQRRSLQEREAQHYRNMLQAQEPASSREALAPGPQTAMPRPALVAPSRSSDRVSYGEVSTSSGSTGRSSDRSSGQRVPTAALGAVGRDSARVLAPEPATSPLAHVVSRPEDVSSERAPLAGGVHMHEPGRPSLLATHEANPAFESESSYYSTRPNGSRNPSYGLPVPTPPMHMPGAFPGERQPMPPQLFTGGVRGSSEPPGHGYSPVHAQDDFDQAHEWNGMGSGRRSLGASPMRSSPARDGGIVRFSNRDEEWRYDDGDDYSDRGGGGGNIYDGYRYGEAH